jgi:methyl-accepting chemotaxis protein
MPPSFLVTRSISTRFLVLTIAMVVVIFGGLGIFIATQNATALRVSLDSKSTSVADLASSTGAEYLANFNFMALDLLVENIAKDRDVVFAGFYNDKKELVTKRPMPAAMGNAQIVSRDLKDANGAVIGTLKIGYRKDTVTKSLMKSIFTLIAGTLAAIVLFSLGISIASRRMILAPVNRLCEAIAKVSEGDLSLKLEAGSNDEIGALATSLNGMVENLNQMVREVNRTSDELNTITGDISDVSGKVVNAAQLQSDGVDSTSSAVTQISASIKGVNQHVAGLSATAAETSSSILEMTASVEEVALNTETLAQSVGEVSSSISQMAGSIKQVSGGVSTLLEAANSTAASVMQMDYSIKQVEKNAADASAISEIVKQDAEIGRAAVEESIAGIDEIERSTEITYEVINSLSSKASEIGSILQVIDDVAEQTNLLSLNAAIIAAQAGEQGKGFAVVAEEIKLLAERTRSSTREIASVVKGVQDETAKAVSAIQRAERSVSTGKALSDKSGTALHKIFEGVRQATDQMKEIATATLEQSKGSQQISEAMEHISTMVRQIDNATREQALGSDLIMTSAERMKSITAQVRNAAMEQSKAGKFIAVSTEHITNMISQIKRACADQERGIEMITGSVEHIQSSASINLEATKMMDQSVVRLFEQIKTVREEMSAFKI